MIKTRENIIYSIVLQGVNYLVPLILLPYLARVLGTSNYGHYIMVLSVANYFVMLTDFGYNLYVSKRISQKGTVKNSISNIYSATLILKSIVAIILSIGVVVFSTFSSGSEYLFVFSILSIAGSVMTPTWFFQGMEIIKKLSLMSIIGRVIILISMLTFVHGESDVRIALFSQCSLGIIVGFMSILYIKRNFNIRFKFVKKTYLKIVFIKAFPLFIAAASVNVYVASTPLILGWCSDVEQVSIFSTADKLRFAIVGFFSVLTGVFYPKISKNILINKNKANDMIKKSFQYQIPVAIFLSSTLFIFSEKIITILFGGDYFNSILVLKILSPLIVIIPVSIILSNYILLPYGFNKVYSMLPILMACVHIVICTILSIRFGAIGAATSTLIVEFLSMISLVVTVYYYRKKIFSL